MHIEAVNVSTGPVQMSRQVQQAFATAAFSHRSSAFYKLYNDTTDFLCKEFSVQKTYLLTGSGTTANETMIQQIKMVGGKGLILSNGEFGSRLIEQAKRAALQFTPINLLWGEALNIAMVENLIQQNSIAWVLFCHCETSTGVMNNIEGISKICAQHNCLCFVDCMSTVGTYPLDLSHVSMATASSGKGLASIPGLAIIFSNMQAVSSTEIPICFDLAYYDQKDGIPFTISSNLVSALYVGIKQKLQPAYFELVDQYSKYLYLILHGNSLLPFNNYKSKVFTIALPETLKPEIIYSLKKERIIVSYESEYLSKRSWLQVALFGYYQENELDYFLKKVEKAMLVYVQRVLF